MNKISVSKELFDDLLLKKTSTLDKKSSKYWKKELLEPKIIDNKISYSIKQCDKLTITNGLGEEKPLLVVECDKIEYFTSNDSFKFHIGKILEQKNTTTQMDYKDNLIKQLIKEKEELEDKIHTDSLTQVYNRQKMMNDVKAFSNQNNSSLLTSIFIDIDELSKINEKYDYSVGDEVLICVAEVLKEEAIKLDGHAYRYGSNEFVILCFISKDRLVYILNNLVESINSKNIVYDDKIVDVTVSIGLSFYIDYNDENIMIKKAYNGVKQLDNNSIDIF